MLIVDPGKRPREPVQPRPLKDVAKHDERQAEWKRLHAAWEVENAAWEVHHDQWRKQQKKANRKRPAADSERRVQKRRAQNPNIIPGDVVQFFEAWRYGDAHCYDTMDLAAFEAGVAPPQALIDFLQNGGSVNAHEAECRNSLLQLAAYSGVGPQIIRLLLDRGAKIDGNGTYLTPMEFTARNWLPFAGHSCAPLGPEARLQKSQELQQAEIQRLQTELDNTDFEGQGPNPDMPPPDLRRVSCPPTICNDCFQVALSAADEAVLRLLLAKGGCSPRTMKYAMGSLTAHDMVRDKQPPCGMDPAMLRRLWNDAKLREMQQLFGEHIAQGRHLPNVLWTEDPNSPR